MFLRKFDYVPTSPHGVRTQNNFTSMRTSESKYECTMYSDEPLQGMWGGGGLQGSNGELLRKSFCMLIYDGFLAETSTV
jgi:hypothetical protein